MCRKPHDTGRLIIITSVAERASQREHCDINDGTPHYHTIRVENQRRETVRVKARSSATTVEFTPAAAPPTTWNADFFGGSRTITRERASTTVPVTHHLHDTITTEFEYSWDDPFTPEEPTVTLQIQVNL
jgi:hypothetical protein